jgi:hypothetical protein
VNENFQVFENFAKEAKDWQISDIHRNFYFDTFFSLPVLLDFSGRLSQLDIKSYWDIVSCAPLFTCLFKLRDEEMYRLLKSSGIIDNSLKTLFNMPDLKNYVRSLIHLTDKNEPFIDVLLENGIDINSPDVQGNTPLHLSCHALFNIVEIKENKEHKIYLNIEDKNIETRLQDNGYTFTDFPTNFKGSKECEMLES